MAQPFHAGQRVVVRAMDALRTILEIGYSDVAPLADVRHVEAPSFKTKQIS